MVRVWNEEGLGHCRPQQWLTLGRVTESLDSCLVKRGPGRQGRAANMWLQQPEPFPCLSMTGTSPQLSRHFSHQLTMQSFLEFSPCAIAYLGHGYKLYDNADVTLKVLTILSRGDAYRLISIQMADAVKEETDGIGCESCNSCCSGLIFLLQRLPESLSLGVLIK